MNAAIVALGHPIKGPALALYERVRELFSQRSIAFKAADPGYRGRVRIEQRRLLIWFSPKSVGVVPAHWCPVKNLGFRGIAGSLQ